MDTTLNMLPALCPQEMDLTGMPRSYLSFWDNSPTVALKMTMQLPVSQMHPEATVVKTEWSWHKASHDAPRIELRAQK